jgi:hypothetical protein
MVIVALCGIATTHLGWAVLSEPAGSVERGTAAVLS